MSTTKHLSASIIEKVFDPKTVLETRKMRFIISTGTKDRGREVVNMDKWHFTQYKSNPVVGYQHAIYGGGLFTDPNPDFVIGKSSVDVSSYQGKKVLESEAEFEPKDINELADKILKKLAFGSLNAASVGILPIGEGSYKKEERTYYYDEQELLEWSVVNIPMNGEATRMSMKQVMVEQANDLFKKIKVDDGLRRTILEQIEKEYGSKEAEQLEMTFDTNKTGADPDLDKYIERFNKLKSK